MSKFGGKLLYESACAMIDTGGVGSVPSYKAIIYARDRIAELERKVERLRCAVAVYAREEWATDYDTDDEAIAEFVDLAWRLGGRMDPEIEPPKIEIPQISREPTPAKSKTHATKGL